MAGNDNATISKKRSRSGCRTCRKRHQKCDERKPTCWNCHFRGVKCGGYGIILTDFTAYSGHKGQMVPKMTRDEPGSGRNILEDDKESTVEDLPSTPWSPVINDEFPEPSMPEDMIGLQEPEILTNETPGALNLESSTSLVSPAEFSAIDQWFPNDHQPTEDGYTGDLSSVYNIYEPIMHVTPAGPFDYYLLNHYINTLCLRLYPMKLDQNPYQIVYGSLVANSEPLHKAIMLASALHFSKLGKLPIFAIKHYRTEM
ncbi:hypothetical protein BO71DRAFT_429767 [Aspergillus ellipticus CBS 707.79]|uniref:Zn(2)-C6 fungal-type domain-containing protein n=1 Tax=Aspergillus ellipticus CBS 707.79 TaxID=1448320 RepID=A0A319DKQ2_9EURO|nr:hypothetical protein BO71DRAFT_429767 [Aspergillus ellipticus CBS 707.79]